VGPNPQTMSREKFVSENGLDLKRRQGESDSVLGPFELDILRSASGWRPKDASGDALRKLADQATWRAVRVLRYCQAVS
jgi:hypothetical protein